MSVNFESLLRAQPPNFFHIISHRGFRNSLKKSAPLLQAYLFSPHTIDLIFKYTIFNQKDNNEKVKLVASSIMVIFKEGSELILTIFSQNKQLIKGIDNFIKNIKKADFFCCGYFQQIVESLTNVSKGNFLTNFPQLLECLLKNIYII